MQAGIRTIVHLFLLLLIHLFLFKLYILSFSDDLDLQHFDPEFTREKISDTPSPPRSSVIIASVQDDTFAGFSYIPQGDVIPE